MAAEVSNVQLRIIDRKILCDAQVTGLCVDSQRDKLSYVANGLIVKEIFSGRHVGMLDASSISIQLHEQAQATKPLLSLSTGLSLSVGMTLADKMSISKVESSVQRPSLKIYEGCNNITFVL